MADFRSRNRGEGRQRQGGRHRQLHQFRQAGDASCSNCSRSASPGGSPISRGRRHLARALSQKMTGAGPSRVRTSIIRLREVSAFAVARLAQVNRPACRIRRMTSYRCVVRLSKKPQRGVAARHQQRDQQQAQRKSRHHMPGKSHAARDWLSASFDRTGRSPAWLSIVPGRTIGQSNVQSPQPGMSLTSGLLRCETAPRGKRAAPRIWLHCRSLEPDRLDGDSMEIRRAEGGRRAGWPRTISPAPCGRTHQSRRRRRRRIATGLRAFEPSARTAGNASARPDAAGHLGASDASNPGAGRPGNPRRRHDLRSRRRKSTGTAPRPRSEMMHLALQGGPPTGKHVQWMEPSPTEHIGRARQSTTK